MEQKTGVRASGPSTSSTAVSPGPIPRLGSRTHTITRPVGKSKKPRISRSRRWMLTLPLEMESDEDPGVYRHASTGAGLRDGLDPQTLTRRDRYHTKRSVMSANMLNSGDAF